MVQCLIRDSSLLLDISTDQLPHVAHPSLLLGPKPPAVSKIIPMVCQLLLNGKLYNTA